MPSFFIYKDQIKFEHFPHHVNTYHFRMGVVFFFVCVLFMFLYPNRQFATKTNVLTWYFYIAILLE